MSQMPNHRFRDKLKTKLWQLLELRKKSVEPAPDRHLILKRTTRDPVMEWSATEETTCFASVGPVGVVDLGASQTVIGDQQVPELLQGIPQEVRNKVRKTACHLVFRFGNHQTLTSKTALIFPVHQTWFRIAIVPGQTPFLLSSAFLKTIQAVIDTDQGTLWSKYLGRFLQTTRSPSNLMLLDINELWQEDASHVQDIAPEQRPEMAIRPKTEGGSDQKVSNASDTSLVKTEECFSQSSMSKSIRVKTNQTDRDNPHPSQSSGNVSRLIQHFDSQARPFLDPLKTREHVQPQPEARCVSKSSQERARSGLSSRSGSAVLVRPQGNEDSLRQSQVGSTIRGSLSRSKVDHVVRTDLREQPEAGTCQIPPLCEPPSVRRINLDANQQSDDDQGNSLPAPFCSGASGLPHGKAGGIGTLGQGRIPARGDLSTPRAAGPSDEQNRVSLDSNHPPPRTEDRGPASPDSSVGDGQGGAQLSPGEVERMCDQAEAHCFLGEPKYDFDFPKDSQPEYSRLCSKCLKQYQEEFNRIAQVIKPKPHKAFLFEVLCSKESELTRQSLQQGLSAKRFGLSEGDLSTTVGRRNMFCHLARDQPENLWVSPMVPMVPFNVVNLWTLVPMVSSQYEQKR